LFELIIYLNVLIICCSTFMILELEAFLTKAISGAEREVVSALRTLKRGIFCHESWMPS
jgi:hypothetical protein